MTAPPQEDTIAAVATPPGQGGIGIIRISGPRALSIAGKIFRPHNHRGPLDSHRLYLGALIDPESGHSVDEVLLSYMKAPRSYTREDVIEINAHSGYLLLSRILHIVFETGARLARPGEFTFRAFMNGRVDLTQAEAVMDLIQSQSDRGIQLACRQISGGLGKEIRAIRGTVLDILARIEAAVDFPEEEETILDRQETLLLMERDLLGPIGAILDAHRQRKIWIDGVQTVIAGRVNVGKSSLLNCLINEERAIVTPVPGTTRDIVESTLHVEGIPLRLMDTAGFRTVTGEVERIGIRRSEEKLAGADLPLIVLDHSRPLTREDRAIAARAKGAAGLILVNKIDLPGRLPEEDVREIAGDWPVVKISALTGLGVKALKRAIRDRVLSGETGLTSHLAPNLRHRESLEEASRLFRSALEVLTKDLPLDLAAEELRAGLDALGDIIGETSRDEVVDRIFSRFCLGK